MLPGMQSPLRGSSASSAPYLSPTRGGSLRVASARSGSQPYSSPNRDVFSQQQSQSQQPAPSTSGTGSVELIIGPMFAGKSTELMRRIQKKQREGARVVIVSSSIDTRSNYDGTGHIKTHDGQHMPAVAVNRLADLHQLPEYTWGDCICIDEAQFFPDLVDFTFVAAEQDGKQLVVAGLSGDFRRQKFGQILELVPLADSVTKLAARCSCCTGMPTPAHFSLRVSADGNQIAVGGSDKYIPVCRKHYVELNSVRQSPQ